jgi:phenylalanyl-tRNA synthetase beta chain
MRRRLKAIGLRPINALVDITNYLTFDRARPLHVFDAKKSRAISPCAAPSRTRNSPRSMAGPRLDADNVVIADDAGVESLAGIMGGQASGCDAATTDVLIESALWDPANIARSGRRLGIHSDARYRFERGVDPAFCLPGLELATRLVVELCGGLLRKSPLLGGFAARPAHHVSWSEVKRLTGSNSTVRKWPAFSRALGSSSPILPAPPRVVEGRSFRPDIEAGRSRRGNRADRGARSRCVRAICRASANMSRDPC